MQFEQIHTHRSAAHGPHGQRHGQRDAVVGIDWAWLEAQPLARSELAGTIRHYRLEQPLEVLVDGVRGMGAVVLEG